VCGTARLSTAYQTVRTAFSAGSFIYVGVERPAAAVLKLSLGMTVVAALPLPGAGVLSSVLDSALGVAYVGTGDSPAAVYRVSLLPALAVNSSVLLLPGQAQARTLSLHSANTTGLWVGTGGAAPTIVRIDCSGASLVYSATVGYSPTADERLSAGPTQYLPITYSTEVPNLGGSTTAVTNPTSPSSGCGDSGSCTGVNAGAVVAVTDGSSPVNLLIGSSASLRIVNPSTFAVDVPFDYSCTSSSSLLCHVCVCVCLESDHDRVQRSA
jgi:hypothetical protein